MLRSLAIFAIVCFILFVSCALFFISIGKTKDQQQLSSNLAGSLSAQALNVGLPKNGYSKNTEKLALLIKQEDADLVFLSEAYGESGDSLYKKLNSLYPYSSYEWGGATNCLYSKYPFRWEHRVARDIDPYAYICRFYVQIADEEIALYCCHLSSNNIREDGSYVSINGVKDIRGCNLTIKTINEPLTYERRWCRLLLKILIKSMS